jgi:predicted  nucleic acid-binding Zn-ribbon protein
MSPALAACAACGHVFSEDEALNPCPKCGATERTLIRDTLVGERSEHDKVVKAHRIEQRQPDGSTELVETYEEFEPEKGRE